MKAEVIPDVKPMKGKEICIEPCGMPKKLTKEEQSTVELALDKIILAYYSVWFGYPVRKIDNIKQDLKDAKQLLAQVKCPEVI